MSQIKPRFEFRTFALDFGVSEALLRSGYKCEAIRESKEIYIMSRQNNENNTKIRDDLMDIKVFVQEKEGYEQWNPRMKGSFPMSAQDLTQKVFPAFGIKMPALERDVYTLSQYLDEIIRPNNDLNAVNIFKRRFAYTVCNAITEVAEILINGAYIKTMAIESTEINDIKDAQSILRLDSYENVNYLKAIKRVTGMLQMADSCLVSRIK
jgi:hypothetical protein